ncbi:BQ5605_C001g00802 [Microbotryum silenes-dioicae]|uniref:BQ5605_C001g00802 protein n=1 Tax=Microbotryum silenes-dioicae TaxID=796604 RepID=A0A2X0MRU2_9BASI|nr:BQ5605_C001g00802 [Microbotryum silenes-dioicae]
MSFDPTTDECHRAQLLPTDEEGDVNEQRRSLESDSDADNDSGSEVGSGSGSGSDYERVDDKPRYSDGESFLMSSSKKKEYQLINHYQSLPRRCNSCQIVTLVAVGLLVVATLVIAARSLLTSEMELVAEELGPVLQEENLDVVGDFASEEEFYAQYQWKEHPPHKSLLNVVRTLNKDEQRIRNWIIETRPRSQAGTPIGLSSKSSRIEPTITRGPAMIKVGSGPGEYRTGSKAKHQALVQEWETGRPSHECKGTPWGEAYGAMHRDVINGVIPPKVMIASCKKGQSCGGTADRFFGLFTSFLYAILTDRAFFVDWADWPFEVFADAVNIDWSRPLTLTTNEATHPKLGTPTSQISLRNFQRPMEALDEFLLDTVWGKHRDEPSWVEINTNRGGALRSFNYTEIAPILKDKGFEYASVYACMTDYLFTPKASAQRYMVQYSSLFVLPSVFSVSMQIRTGDANMESADADSHMSVESHRRFFVCAEQLAAKYAKPGQKIVYYLVSDSEHLKHDAMTKYPDRIVTTGFTATHPEIKDADQSQWHRQKHLLDGTTQVMVSSWLLSKTDYQIVTYDSGFGKLPVFERGREGRTVQLAKKVTNSAAMPDCTDPAVFASFESLASRWSYGR